MFSDIQSENFIWVFAAQELHFLLLFFRKDQNLLSPVNCWYLLLNQVGFGASARLFGKRFGKIKTAKGHGGTGFVCRWGGRARTTPRSATSTWTTSSPASRTSARTPPACWRGWVQNAPILPFNETKEHLVTQLVTRPRRLTAFKGLSGGKKPKKTFSLSALRTDSEAERIRRLHESDRKPKSNKSCNFAHMRREKNES